MRRDRQVVVEPDLDPRRLWVEFGDPTHAPSELDLGASFRAGAPGAGGCSLGAAAAVSWHLSSDKVGIQAQRLWEHWVHGVGDTTILVVIIGTWWQRRSAATWRSCQGRCERPGARRDAAAAGMVR